MSADSRFFVSVVCIATACALLSAPASAGLFRCWKHGDAASKEGVTKVPAHYPCKGQVEVGTFKAAKDVWWGHRNRSFGNYLAFNKVDIPKPRVKKAKPAPKFQHILFDLDKSTLKPDAVAIADKVVAYLKANPSEKVCIEGHACDLASDKYNMDLSKRRAKAVTKYLIEQGIDAKRLTAKAYGESKLLSTDPVKRMLNRRAVVLVCRDCCCTKK
jgi:outer membrane protein OmpA-like peptidoglycan-associated protein